MGQVVSAVFAAVAAGASWASAAQNRRERKERAVPELHMEVIQRIPSNEVDVHVTNYGGPAKKVTFCVVENGQVAYGHLPPNSFLATGEGRTVSTRLVGGDEPAQGYVSGFNLSGDRLYTWAMNGKEKRWRFKRRVLREPDMSDKDVLRHFYPAIADIETLPWVTYELRESRDSSY